MAVSVVSVVLHRGENQECQVGYHIEASDNGADVKIPITLYVASPNEPVVTASEGWEKH